MRHMSFSAATAIALFLPASSAFALTPEEVWENWKIRTGTNTEVTVESEQRNGDTLEVKGITFAAKFSDDIRATVKLDGLNLKAQPDNTVLVTAAEAAQFVIFTPDTGEDGDTLNITQQGFELVASGTVDAVSYDGKASRVTASGTVESDDSGRPLAIELTLLDAKGRDTTTKDADGTVTTSGDFSSGTGSFTLKGSSEDGPDSIVVTGEIASLTGTTSTQVPAAADSQNLMEALNNGLSFKNEAVLGAITFKADVTEDGENTTVSGSIGSLATLISLSQKAVDYSVSTGSSTITVEGDALPMPQVELSFAEAGYRILMPLAKSDTAEDFAYETRIVDLKLSDSVWSLFDPTEQLGREPITVIADAKGKGALLVDLLDPGLQDGSADVPDMPIRLESLDLTQLLVKAVGAELNAAGALTFDSNDLESWEGIPAPTGKITANAKGLNALLDKLVAFGVASPDDITGVRMMIAMFTKPGANPDELVSELDFNGASLSINGQRIR